MKYRIGLDLGVGSIGVSIIELDDKNNATNIIDAGVRIFEVSENAEERRLKRGARKNLIRTQKRLQLLAKILFENQLWVNTKPDGTNKLKALSPYKIRYDGIHEKLADSNYIGRALLHMAKHRGAGFVSAKEDVEEEVLDTGETSKKKSDCYEKMYEHLNTSKSKTLGEFFYHRIQESFKKNDSKLRIIRRKDYAIKGNIVDYAIPRYLVKEEFNLFWDTQARYFPQMTPELKQSVYNILFFERPSMPYPIGKCLYIREETRLCKAHPLSEMRRIYEEVNNIRITSPLEKRKLSLAQRDIIIDTLLLQGQNAGKKSIKTALKLDSSSTISLYDNKNIRAYLYSRPEFAQNKSLQALSQNELESFIEFLENPINPNDKNGRLFTEDELMEQLKVKLKTPDEKYIVSLLNKLPKGRTSLGKTATTLILENLKKDVITHREVTDNLAKTDSRFCAFSTPKSLMQLPYYGEILHAYTSKLPQHITQNNKTMNADEAEWGKISNPAVHMILNQLRLVINEIIKIYGRPYGINIELGREVGMSSKNKKQFESEQNKKENFNNKAKKELNDRNLPITAKNILKYKLAIEQEWKDAYNPTSQIPKDFQGFEIEHLIPQSRGGTDVFYNLVLANANDNLAKGDRYPYEYFVATKTDEELREILKNARKRSKEKSWRFESSAREQFEKQGDDEERTRHLTDTRYVAKLAQQYLAAIIDSTDADTPVKRILPVRGKQTAKLRQKWYLDGLEYDLMGLNIPRYIECAPYWVEIETGLIHDGETKPDIDGNWQYFNKKKNPKWNKKPRIDHRHHAMDAIVVGCVNWSLIQKMANETALNKIDYPLPCSAISSTGEFRRYIIDTLKKIKVSHKPNHSKSGELHEETGRIFLGENPNELGYTLTVYGRKILSVVKSIKDLKKLIVPDKVKNDEYPQIEEDRIKQAELVRHFNQYIDTAKEALVQENEQNFDMGKKSLDVTESRIIFKAFQMIQKDGLWKGEKFKCYENSASLITLPKRNLVYKSGNNHRVDFYNANGKIGWEVICRFDANQKEFIPSWKKEGHKLIWFIQQGDLMELNTPEEWKTYTDKDRCFAKVKKFSTGVMTIDYITDARMTSPKEKDLDYMKVNSLTKGLSYFTKAHARKIELTPFGHIKKKHKVLWHGPKTTP